MSLQTRLREMSAVAQNIVPLISYAYEGEQDAGCPVCGAQDNHHVSNWDRRLKPLKTVACLQCGLLHTNPMPREDELVRYYSSLYRLDYQLALGRPSARHVRKRTREAARRSSVILPHLSRGARALDFGAGSGEFVAGLVAAGIDAYGFDPGEGYASHARDTLGARIKTCRWEDVKPDRPFDMVSSFHVLEHLRNPVAALQAAASWLKPEGLLIIEVPDTVRELQKRGFGSLHFAHVIGFNCHNLDAAAARAGFEPLVAYQPTGIVFRKAADHVDFSGADARARQLTRATLEGQSLSRTYVAHHLGKLRFTRRKAVANQQAG